MITTFDLDEYVHGALLAGATGFLLKDAGPELLGEAIRAATRGDSLISPSITRRLLSTFAGTGRAAPPAQPLDPLTEREEQVLLTIARGRTNAEIAAELNISLSTVKTHLGSLMAKLGARNRVEVAMWGTRPAGSGSRGRPAPPAGEGRRRRSAPRVRGGALPVGTCGLWAAARSTRPTFHFTCTAEPSLDSGASQSGELASSGP